MFIQFMKFNVNNKNWLRLASYEDADTPSRHFRFSNNFFLFDDDKKRDNKQHSIIFLLRGKKSTLSL